MTAIEGMRTQEVALNIQVILNGAAEHSLPDHYRWEQCTAIKDQFKQKDIFTTFYAIRKKLEDIEHNGALGDGSIQLKDIF